MEYLLFFARRTGQAVLVLLGLSVLMFVLARVVPGDPGRLALGPNATTSQVAALDHDYGLDRPIRVQYGRYLGGAVHGDFGTAILTRHNVFDDLRSTFPATFKDKRTILFQRQIADKLSPDTIDERRWRSFLFRAIP